MGGGGWGTVVSLLKRYLPFKAWQLLYVPIVFTFQNYKLCPHSSLYALYVSQNKQRNLLYTAFDDCFYNTDGKCSMRGENWVFI